MRRRMPFVEIQPLLNASCTLLFQVCARTSVGYGENSTAWDITLSTKGQPGKKIDFQDYSKNVIQSTLGLGMELCNHYVYCLFYSSSRRTKCKCFDYSSCYHCHICGHSNCCYSSSPHHGSLLQKKIQVQGVHFVS